MARFTFIDSFDHYSTAFLYDKWSYNLGGSNNSAIGAFGRRGTQGLRVQSIDSTQKNLPFRATKLVAGVSTRPETFSSATSLRRAVYLGRNAGSTHFFLVLNSDARLSWRVYVGNTLYWEEVVRGFGTIQTGVQHYIEIKVDYTLNGIAQVWVDGIEAVEMRVPTTSLIYTGNGDGSNVPGIDGLGLGSDISGTPVLNFDDFYLDCVDGEDGDTDVTRWGDVQIKPLHANAPGFYQEFTPSNGTDHTALVDEILVNPNDYVFSDVGDAKEIHNLDDAGDIEDIKCAQVVNHVSKSVSGEIFIRNKIRTAGVDFESGIIPVQEGGNYAITAYVINPNTGVEWTAAEIDALQSGVEIVP